MCCAGKPALAAILISNGFPAHWQTIADDESSLASDVIVYSSHQGDAQHLERGARLFSCLEKRMNELVQPVTAKFDRELFDELRESARRNRCSLSEIVRLSMLEHLEHTKPQRSEHVRV
jgi:hypothetical protein